MEAYFNDVVDPVMRPMLAKIKTDQPTKEDMCRYIIAYMVALEGRENNGFRSTSGLMTGAESVPRAPSVAESKEAYHGDCTEPLSDKHSEKQSEKDAPSASTPADANALRGFALKARAEDSAEGAGELFTGEAALSAEVVAVNSDALPQAPPGIERDSALAEDAVSLRQLLLPAGYDPLGIDINRDSTKQDTSTGKVVAAAPTPPTLSSFSVAYNRSVLEGWVKQPSPCCGAAAVAGAWNACLGYGRDDPRAESHLTTVPIFAALLQDQADAIRGRFERLLGAPLAPLLDELHAELALQGRAIGLGPKKSDVPTKSELLGLVKTIVAREREKAKRLGTIATGDSSGVDEGMSRGEEVACGEMKEGNSESAAREGGAQAQDRTPPFAESKEQEGVEERVSDKESPSSYAAAATTAVAASSEISTVVYDEGKCALVFLRLGELMDEDDAIREAKKARAREEGGGEDNDDNMTEAAAGGAVGDDNDEEESDNDDDDDDDDDEADGAGPSRDVKGEEGSSGNSRGACLENNNNKGTSARSGTTLAAAESFDVPISKKKKPLKKKSTLGGGGASGKAKKKKAGGGGGRSAWAWKNELGDWLHKCGGLAKINNWPRPSTAAFGNWGILGAVRRMASSRFDVDMVAMTFMGKKSRLLTEQANSLAKQTSSTSINGNGGGDGGEPLPPYVGLSRDDRAGAVAAQWSALRSAFGRRDACLVFHLKNHYALVYALREWVEDIVDEAEKGQEEEGKQEPAAAMSASTDDVESKSDVQESSAGCAEAKMAVEEVGSSNGATLPPGAPISPPAPPPRRGRVVRQLLTSRRGQRPSAWVDFDEARETMLGWGGYKLLLVERRA